MISDDPLYWTGLSAKYCVQLKMLIDDANLLLILLALFDVQIPGFQLLWECYDNG